MTDDRDAETIARLTRERDEALAEVERLRETPRRPHATGTRHTTSTARR